MQISLELTQILVAILYLVAAMLGWFARTVYDIATQTRQELNQHKLDSANALGDHKIAIAREYVEYDRLEKVLKPINESLRDIFNELKSKADKP